MSGLAAGFEELSKSPMRDCSSMNEFLLSYAGHTFVRNSLTGIQGMVQITIGKFG
jgi:hypothetical protein